MSKWGSKKGGLGRGSYDAGTGEIKLRDWQDCRSGADMIFDTYPSLYKSTELSIVKQNESFPLPDPDLQSLYLFTVLHFALTKRPKSDPN